MEQFELREFDLGKREDRAIYTCIVDCSCAVINSRMIPPSVLIIHPELFNKLYRELKDSDYTKVNVIQIGHKINKIHTFHGDLRVFTTLNVSTPETIYLI